jgi:Ca-activated chloride channel family protein
VRLPRKSLPRSTKLGTGALFGVVLAAAASLMLLRANDPVACETMVPFKIAAAPAIAPAVDEITRRDVPAGCVELRVMAQSAADTARLIASGDATAPSLWIPDSTMWPQRSEQLAESFGDVAPDIQARDPLVMSPLVVVTTKVQGGQLGWPDTPVSWRDLIAGPVAGQATIGDPAVTTEGLATLAAVRTLLGSPDGAPAPELVGAMLQVGRNAAPSMQSAYDRLSGGTPLAFTATEQSVVTFNRGNHTTTAVAGYPTEGTMALEYPVVRVVAGNEPPEVAAAADLVEQAQRAPAATETLLAAGFRGLDGVAGRSVSPSVGVKKELPKLLPAPTAAQATDLLRTWTAVTLDSRMLVVVDLSGSMNADAGNGRSRIELARDAAVAALDLVPDSASVGLWAFSIAQTPTTDWAELVPLGPLGDPLGDAKRRDVVRSAAESMPSRTGGGTALNDTALAAFRNVNATFQPGQVNSVVLFTDGRNEDPDSIDTNTLLQTLRTEFDPTKPVPIITIGLGPDVDFDALRAISEATGGKAYLTRNPTDIRGVFLDALIQRQCRPNC